MTQELTVSFATKECVVIVHLNTWTTRQLIRYCSLFVEAVFSPRLAKTTSHPLFICFLMTTMITVLLLLCLLLCLLLLMLALKYVSTIYRKSVNITRVLSHNVDIATQSCVITGQRREDAQIRRNAQSIITQNCAISL